MMSYRLTLITFDSQINQRSVSICAPRVTMPSGDYRIIGQIFNLSFRRETEPEVPERPTIRTQELPIGIHVEVLYDDKIELTNTTKYGEPYLVTSVGELKKLVLPRECDPYDKATMAYINALPEHWQIVIELS